MTPKVGDVVFIKDLSWRERHLKELETKPATVEKVGRKWFTVVEHKWDRFSIEAGFCDGKGYEPSMKAYSSIIEEQNERIANENRNKVTNYAFNKLSDTEIHEVLVIIERAEYRKLETSK